jgi:hypothetical protein
MHTPVDAVSLPNALIQGLDDLCQILEAHIFVQQAKPESLGDGERAAMHLQDHPVNMNEASASSTSSAAQFHLLEQVMHAIYSPDA